MTTGRKCVESFEHGIKLSAGNYFTDGKKLFLFGVLIAEHRQDGIYFSMAGYQTVTTAKCLNFLSGVRISTKKGVSSRHDPYPLSEYKNEIDPNEWYRVGNIKP